MGIAYRENVHSQMGIASEAHLLFIVDMMINQMHFRYLYLPSIFRQFHINGIWKIFGKSQENMLVHSAQM